MRGPSDECQPRSFAPRFGLDSGRYAPCVQPETPAGHQRENIGAASDVSPKSVQFSVAKSVQFSVAIDTVLPLFFENPLPSDPLDPSGVDAAVRPVLGSD